MYKYTNKFLPILMAITLLAITFVPSLVVAQERYTIVDLVVDINNSTGEFDTLLAAVLAADPRIAELLSTGQFTVFAPTDQAFEDLFLELGISAADLLADQELLNQILFYHITQGRLYAADVLSLSSIRMLRGGDLYQAGGVLTDQRDRTASIIQVDVEADTGIVHVIDNVVLPKPLASKTIVELVLEINAATGEFDTLIAALLAADPPVLDRLANDGQFTVFAPTDAAFDALFVELGIEPADLLADSALLKEVLMYHVTQGRLYASDVLALSSIRMLRGGFLLQNAGVLTDQQGRTASIIQTDVEATNGIIHVIDTVVLP